jgi:hypothetical protein
MSLSPDIHTKLKRRVRISFAKAVANARDYSCKYYFHTFVEGQSNGVYVVSMTIVINLINSTLVGKSFVMWENNRIIKNLFLVIAKFSINPELTFY